MGVCCSAVLLLWAFASVGQVYAAGDRAAGVDLAARAVEAGLAEGAGHLLHQTIHVSQEGVGGGAKGASLLLDPEENISESGRGGDQARAIGLVEAFRNRRK